MRSDLVELVDANHGNRGEMCLVHRHVGVDLRMDWANEVLSNLTLLWRRPVRLETRRGNQPIRLGHDGKNATEQSLVEPRPAPAARAVRVAAAGAAVSTRPSRPTSSRRSR